MVILLRKKKQTTQSSLVRGTILQHTTKNQLVQAVSPIEELLPSSSPSPSARLLSTTMTTSSSATAAAAATTSCGGSMIRFKSFSMTRRKHSSQRDQLAKLKVMGLFESSAALVSDYDQSYHGTYEDLLKNKGNNSNNSNNNSNGSKDEEEEIPFYTGLLSTPTARMRKDKNLESVVVDLKQPFDLIHQGISHKTSQRRSFTSKTKSTKASKMMTNASSNAFGRNKFKKIGPSSPVVSTDLYASRAGCYGSGGGGWRRRAGLLSGGGGGRPPLVTTAMMGCGGAEVVAAARGPGSGLMMGGAHQVPCIISITTEFEDDDSSEISLEDVLVYMSSSSTATASTVTNDTTTGQPRTTAEATTFTTTSTATNTSPTAAMFNATNSCMPTIFAAAEWQSTDSSISWPSDEDDADDEGTDDDDDKVIVRGEDEDLLADRPKTLPMITGMKDLTFSDNDGSESDFYFKPQLACAGFKFWSATEDEIKGKFPPGTLIAAAARDEENCRDRDENDNQDTARV